MVGSIAEKEKYFNDVVIDINKNNIIDLMGETLTQTFAYIKKSNLFIGNDSGLMHLSVASKISTIGLFGPTNDKIYAPYGNNCYTLRTKETYHHFTKIIYCIIISSLVHTLYNPYGLDLVYIPVYML